MDIVHTEHTEQLESLDNFLKLIPFSRVSRIHVVLHSHGWLLPALYDKLTALSPPKVPALQILLPNPLSTDLKGAQWMKSVFDQELNPLHRKGFNLEVRYYENSPAMEGIMCELEEGLKAFGIHVPPVPAPTRPPGLFHCFYNNGTPSMMGRQFLEHFWFLWGKHPLHTIAFDFDDTLFASLPYRIEAWQQTVKDYAAKSWFKRSMFGSEIRKMIKDEAALGDKIREIFFREQVDPRVLDALFAPEVPAPLKQSIYQHRFEYMTKK